LTGSIAIRPPQPGDVALLFSLIVELAEYERAADRVTGTEELLEQALFGPGRSVEAVIAELGGAPVGFALFFPTFSTWLCRPGLWLEDLYVSPEHRRAGVGGVLLSHLAELALERGCGRLEWSALNWNTPALDFYERLGAERLHEWHGFRLEGAALAQVADGPAGPPAPRPADRPRT
jgi:GNAT superfamily N-acetyltransferase